MIGVKYMTVLAVVLVGYLGYKFVMPWWSRPGSGPSRFKVIPVKHSDNVVGYFAGDPKLLNVESHSEKGQVITSTKGGIFALSPMAPSEVSIVQGDSGVPIGFAVASKPST